jgi:uncharacterized membrane protein YeiB
VLLAGIGISLLSGNARRSNAPQATVPIRNTLLKRALFLFVVGLLYTPVWPADILHFYGVYIAVAALLLTSSIQKLSILSFLLMVGFVFMFFAFNYEHQTLSFSLLASGIFFISSVVFAYLWCGRFKRGPIEMLMRYLTEKKLS